MTILIVLLIILAILIIFSGYVVNLTIHPKTKEYEFTHANEIEKGVFTKEYYDNLQKEEVIIKSPHDYDIHGIWMPWKNSNKIVVIAHGYTYSLFGSIKYVELFHRLGYSAFVYDQRFHGLSGGKSSTFGFKEKDDLKAVFDYLIDRFGEDALIGTHGESLGGATVLLHAAEDDRVRFVVSDCAFSDMKTQLAYRLKEEFKLPKVPLIYLASWINRLVIGNFYNQVSPLNTAHLIKAPTMIIHGTQDDYTPYWQGQDIYEKLICKKYFYGADGAKHAKSLIVDKERYFEEMKAFLTDLDY